MSMKESEDEVKERTLYSEDSCLACLYLSKGEQPV